MNTNAKRSASWVQPFEPRLPCFLQHFIMSPASNISRTIIVVFVVAFLVERQTNGKQSKRFALQPSETNHSAAKKQLTLGQLGMQSPHLAPPFGWRFVRGRQVGPTCPTRPPGPSSHDDDDDSAPGLAGWSATAKKSRPERTPVTSPVCGQKTW